MSALRARTAVVVPVPGAEHALRPWRATYTADGRDGTWAHVTVLYPFLEPAEVAAELPALREHFAPVRPFAFTLAAVRRHLPPRALALEAWLVELAAEGWSVRERLPFRG